MGRAQQLPAPGNSADRSVYERISTDATYLGTSLAPAEIADLAEQHCMGDSELTALAKVFSHLAKKRHDQTIEMLLRLSRLPRKAPKTFEGFDFERIQGKDADALKQLPSLANLYARKNIAFIGPGGIGKTHLAQAYGYQCCLSGFKTYYIKATELKDKLERAIASKSTSRAVSALTKPACLIIDEIGRCTFDRQCTNLLFDIIDRRYEKDCPNTMILTSNTPANNWQEFFSGDDTLLCALDRVFDRATVFLMKGPSFRGRELETFAVESMPLASKVKR